MKTSGRSGSTGADPEHALAGWDAGITVVDVDVEGVGCLVVVGRAIVGGGALERRGAAVVRVVRPDDRRVVIVLPATTGADVGGAMVVTALGLGSKSYWYSVVVVARRVVVGWSVVASCAGSSLVRATGTAAASSRTLIPAVSRKARRSRRSRRPRASTRV
jgi:hypothetical protein